MRLQYINGNNGCGKSGILNLVFEYHIPYCVEFHKGSNLIISYVSQNPNIWCGTLSDYAAANKIEESFSKQFYANKILQESNLIKRYSTSEEDKIKKY